MDIPTKPVLPTDEAIIELIDAAVQYPSHVRIAAWYVASGGTEEKWAETIKRLRQLPDLFMVNIQNAIRDIERGRYGENWEKTIPSIGLIHLQRVGRIPPEEAAEYRKIRAKVEQDLPDLIAQHHVRMISQDGAEEYKKNKKS